MITNEEMRKVLRNVKIFQISCLASILIYVIILIVLPYIGFVPIFAGDNPFLTVLAGILGIAAVIGIVFGYFQSRRSVKLTNEGQRNQLYAAVVFSRSLFVSVALDGLVLGVVGAGWIITLPFFIVATGALIHTFPTEERWRMMMERGTRIA